MLPLKFSVWYFFSFHFIVQDFLQNMYLMVFFLFLNFVTLINYVKKKNFVQFYKLCEKALIWSNLINYVKKHYDSHDKVIEICNHLQGSVLN